MKSRTKGLVYLNAAAILFGGTSLFAKLISLPISTIIFSRCVVASIVLGTITLFLKQSLKPDSKRDWVSLLILGIIMGFHWVTYFYSIRISTVAIGVITLFTYPIITVILEPLLNRERVHLRDVALALLTFSGVFLMIPEMRLENEVTWGIVIGLFSALAFAVRNIGMRKYVSHYSGSRVMFFQVFVISLFLLPTADFSPDVWNRRDAVYIVILGIFFTAAPHTLLVASLRYLKVKTVSIVGSSQTLFASLFAFFILGEIPTQQTLLGGVLILGCALFETFFRQEKKVPGNE